MVKLITPSKKISIEKPFQINFLTRKINGIYQQISRKIISQLVSIVSDRRPVDENPD